MSVLKMALKSHEELAQEEDREARDEQGGEHDPQQRVHQSQVLDQDEVGQQGEDLRDHQRAQEDQEHGVPAAPAQAREGVGRHRAGEGLDHGDRWWCYR